MHGTKILCEERPKGVFLEGYISSTPKPGTVMQVKAATEPVNNRFTWEAFNQAADGTLALIAVLLEKEHEGKTYDDAYADGDWGYLYCPVAGEQLNMLVANVSGTADTFAIGDRMMVDDTTGKLVADSSGASVPFIILETEATALTADEHKRCMYTGH
jgi:hypothetical protein